MLIETANDAVVYVVDDDVPSCRAVTELVRSFGQRVKSYASAREFLDSPESRDADQIGCVVTDLRMPGLNGLELHEKLVERGVALPVILVTAFADTALTVRAMRHGAIAVLDKPFRDDELWSFVQEAIDKSEVALDRLRRRQELEERFKMLTPQDRKVLQLLLEGCKNQVMANRLSVSLRTVENRRKRVFNLMKAESIAELAMMVCEYENNLPQAEKGGGAWHSLPFERSA